MSKRLLRSLDLTLDYPLVAIFITRQLSKNIFIMVIIGFSIGFFAAFFFMGTFRLSIYVGRRIKIRPVWPGSVFSSSDWYIGMTSEERLFFLVGQSSEF